MTLRPRFSEFSDSRVVSDRAEVFLDELEALCRKHGLSIGHEDGHGAFILEALSEHNIEWVRAAQLGSDYPYTVREVEP